MITARARVIHGNSSFRFAFEILEGEHAGGKWFAPRDYPGRVGNEVIVKFVPDDQFAHPAGPPQPKRFAVDFFAIVHMHARHVVEAESEEEALKKADAYIDEVGVAGMEWGESAGIERKAIEMDAELQDQCGNCGRQLQSDGSCRGGCATPADPD